MLWSIAADDLKKGKKPQEEEEVLFRKAKASETPAAPGPAGQFVAAKGFSDAEGKDCRLSQNTRLKGNLNTADDITLFGRLEGNIVSTGRARILSALAGDVTAKSVVLEGGQVTGIITAKEAVYVESGSTVHGNVNAGRLFLRSGAAVYGDVKATEISMEVGAKVSGHMEIGGTAAQKR